MRYPEPGTILSDKYRIVRLLGSGGMGAVFEAENTRTFKSVAIKWLHPELALHGEAAPRLLREAQAAARIRHPNVVDVYDVEHDERGLFLVMELLEGESLGVLVARHAVPLRTAIEWLIGAMRGVAEAHRQGVVHRDIKPDNIFMVNKGGAPALPKVLDFGISKLEARGREQLSLTQTGRTLGTPFYMSLEQIKGARDVDARTDIYAFGVILYELITGSLPYRAETLCELAINIAMNDPVAPTELRPEIPDALGHLVLQAIAKQREARIPSLDAFIDALSAFAAPEGLAGALLCAAPSTLSRAGKPSKPVEPVEPRAVFHEDAQVSAPVAATQSGTPRRRFGKRARWATGVGLALLAALALSYALVGHDDPSADPQRADLAEPVPAEGTEPGAAASAPPRAGPLRAPVKPEATGQPDAAKPFDHTQQGPLVPSSPRERRRRAASPPASPDRATPRAPTASADTPARPDAKPANDSPPRAPGSESPFRAGKPLPGDFYE